MSNKKLVLVDGSYYLFRAYHAMPAFTNSRNEPTGAIYGVMNMLKKLLQQEQPDYFAVVFDPRGKTMRNDLYADYKANRPPMPDDLACQIEPLHEIIEANGYPKLIVDGIEADDVIATLCRQAEQSGIHSLVSTGDKDLAQMVNSHITLLNTMQDVVLDEQGVIDKFGVKPDQIIDYLSLIGDKVDNIPGVPKVGPKTAVKWLHEYGSVDEIIKRAEEIKGKVGESLRDNLDQLSLARELVTLNYAVPVELKPEQLVIEAANTDALKQHYDRWEFRTWLHELDRDPTATEIVEETTEYETVLDKDSFSDWLQRLEASSLFAFDTETTSLDYMQAELVGVSFAVEAMHAAYVPFAHDYEGAPSQLSRDYVLSKLKPLLEDKSLYKVGQNLKYDMNVLGNYDIKLQGIAHDTMLESYIIDSTATRHDMDSLANKYLGVETVHYEDIAGKGVKQKTFNLIELEQAAPYAAEDADITFRLHQSLWPKLEQQSTLADLYQELEVPLISVLSRMERNGVKISESLLHEQSRELEEKLGEIERQAHEHAGEVFNISSPKQIQQILYEKMKLPVLSKTAKGQPSTAESVLQDLAAEHELPQLILDFRSLSKLKSTYTDKLPQQINSRTGRVHTSYHQAVAATGRLSSSDPNLQNIPIRTEEGRRIRAAFIAEPGKTLMAADYSQIELRIMAHLSDDERLLEAFAKGEDVHKSTAAEVFDTELGKVSPEQRRAAKAINFGLIYGMSAFGLAKQLGIECNRARDYVETYFSRYPGVKKYMDETREAAHEKGFVETLFGRRLYLPEINSRNAMRRQYAERTAINAPMQGTAADIIKRAMLAVQAWLDSEAIDAMMIMQVHDELVFEIADSQLDGCRQQIKQMMENAAQLKVPLLVDSGTGLNWHDAH